MSTGRKVSFGVIGCGNVANNYYLPYIARHHRLVAVSDKIAERARRSSELWGAERWYSDPEKLLADPEVEAVVIATSHESHAPLAIRASEQGKHFIVQKPMATSLEDAEKVVKSVEKSGVIALAEPSDALLSPLYRVLKAELTQLGRHCFSVWHTGHSGPMWSEAFLREEAGGGVLFDLAVYDVARLLTLFGEPKRVAALGSILLKTRLIIDTDTVTASIRPDTYGRGTYYFHDVQPTLPVEVTAFDNFAGILEYDGGLAVILANYVTFHGLRAPPIQIYCTDGAATVEPWTPQITVVAKGSTKVLGRKEIGVIRPYYHESVDHLAECIVKGAEPLPSVQWGYKVTKILLELQRAAKSL
ncbi:MAG: Gfo/Idh/MocA family oxidoreductase [Thermofilaceae archaeon]